MTNPVPSNCPVIFVPSVTLSVLSVKLWRYFLLLTTKTFAPLSTRMFSLHPRGNLKTGLDLLAVRELANWMLMPCMGMCDP